MAQPQLQDLLEAGVHFGHQTRRWNPKMRRFIFAERSGIYIIDLQKTLRQIQKAQELLRSVVLKGDGVLFVCTKKQLKAIVQLEAQNAGAFYVTERWLGGMLTNFQTLKKQIRRLRDLEQGAADGDFENYTKKEKLLFERERVKLSRNLEGIKLLGRLPGALFVVDAKKEKIAVAEANKLGIPVVAIVDTNADPDIITVPVPGNDDAIRSVSLITVALSDVIKEARAQMPMREVAEDLEAETYSTDTGSEGDYEADRKRRRPRRKRRPKPEAIAARLKTEADVPLFIAGKRREPHLAHVHGLERLALRALLRQPHRQAGVEERDGDVTAVAALVAGARVGCPADRRAFGQLSVQLRQERVARKPIRRPAPDRERRDIRRRGGPRERVHRARPEPLPRRVLRRPAFLGEHDVGRQARTNPGPVAGPHRAPAAQEVVGHHPQ